jgi:cation diffusion facilitator CzcD-associated flavoprotein CzcO
MLSEHSVVVIGAGPAGIAAALSLRDRGVRALVVDRADAVGSSWRTRYDRLKLNTGRQFSHLPKRRYPPGTPTFPTRDQVVAHFETHARGLDIRLNTTVERIDRRPGGWRLQASAGDIDARQVVVATGYEHTAYMPESLGVHGFTGEVLHSSRYRNPRPYGGKRVMVVGSGSSGMEIARSGHRRGSQGVDVGPHAAQHHAAQRSGRASRRCDRDAPLSRANPHRRQDCSACAAAGHR